MEVIFYHDPLFLPAMFSSEVLNADLTLCLAFLSIQSLLIF